MGPLANANTPIQLRRDGLTALPASIGRPSYQRSDLKAGIVHIGLGNFHRAHQAWYIHKLMQTGQALDWAIVGAGVRPFDSQMRDRLIAQDCLTTLIELDPTAISAEVIGPMIDYLPIENGNGPLIRKMADPAIRIVSLTVTEGGYYLDATSGAFDTDHEDIRHDAQNPDAPRTVFGAILAALRLRRAADIPPFTALSCDNLQGNGAILRRCTVGLARLSDPEFADWVAQNGAFPNSMVDCIVPATTDRVREQAYDLGIDDRAPVSHENFRQWVLEDAFCAGRPPLEQVGVTITDDVHAFERMKLRILNGGHQLLANVGELLSLPTISDCMGDAQVAQFFRKVQKDEITPYVQAVAGATPAEYLTQVETRFANTAIEDTTRRVAFDGSARHPGFLLPSLRDALNAGAAIDGLALAEAFWARMCSGIREDGTGIEANDPIWADLQATAEAARETPDSWLAQQHLYGDLSANTRFTQAFAYWLNRVWQTGSRRALDHYLTRAP